MTPLEKTLLSHRIAYGIDLLCVHAAWIHDRLYGEDHQLAVEAHGRAKTVWLSIDESMQRLDAHLRSTGAMKEAAAEYRSDRKTRLSVRKIPSPSGQVRQAGAPSKKAVPAQLVSSQPAAKLQEAS